MTRDDSPQPTSPEDQPWKISSMAVAGVAFLALVLIAVIAAQRMPLDGSRASSAQTATMQPLRLFDDAATQVKAIRVTDFAGTHRQPTLSPDGQVLAFTSDASGEDRIWVQDIDGGEPRAITADGTWPVWSPRGDRIAYQRLVDGVSSLWSIDPSGTLEPTMIVERGATPGFSPDGATIVYEGPNREVWMAASDGADQRRVAGIAQSAGPIPRLPAFSATGDAIVFVHADEGPYGDLWVLPLSGGGAQRLTYDVGIGLSDGAPVPIADDTVVFAARNAVDSGAQLWRVSIAGGELERLTTGAGAYQSPALSRDATRALFVRTLPDRQPERTGDSEIWMSSLTRE